METLGGFITLSTALTTDMSTPPRQLKPGFFTADTIVRRTVPMGIKAVDTLLGGGLEVGLMHLFYGDKCLHDDVLSFAVKAQMPKEQGGLAAPVIMIDSANVIKIEQLTDNAHQLEVDPEVVMDRVYVSRAFNSSQTYDLIMNQLEGFFTRVPARTLIVTGLPSLYMQEGMEGKSLQELSHMASKLKTFTLQRNLVTVVTGPSADGRPQTPAGGKTLASGSQIHIRVDEHQSYVMYTLAKHPQYPVRRSKRTKSVAPHGIIPLSHFLKGREEQD
jgi:hypothetical protein